MTEDTLPQSSRAAHDIAHLELVPRKHLGRKISAAIVLLLVALLIRAFVVGQIEWNVVGQFLLAPAIVNGIWNTLAMTVAAMSLGIVLGVVIAIMRISGNPVLEWIALVYVWIFRGAPALLQLLLWFNLALIFPTMGIPGLFSFNTVEVMTPFVAAMLGLGIQQGAYTSEVVRSGLLSVDQGQYEAARTIGMTGMQTLRRIVLPQMVQRVLPPMSNETITLVKDTSLIYVLALNDILRTARGIVQRDFTTTPFLVAAAFYLIMTLVLTWFFQRMEKRYAKYDQ